VAGDRRLGDGWWVVGGGERAGVVDHEMFRIDA
jgi:hypothetical protein